MTNHFQPVLIVDDDPYVLEAVTTIVALEGHPTVVARDATEALAKVEGVRLWLVVTHLQMTPMDGCELVTALRERISGLPAVIMTGDPDARPRVEALPAAYLAKPFDLRTLLGAIAAATKVVAR